MAEQKSEPKAKKWKIKGGDTVALVDPFGGIFEFTNKHLEDPVVLTYIGQIETKSGHKIFGVMIVEE